jgi:hypothetical protein
VGSPLWNLLFAFFHVFYKYICLSVIPLFPLAFRLILHSPPSIPPKGHQPRREEVGHTKRERR